MLQKPNRVWFAVFCPEGAFVICWTPGLVVLLMDGLNCKSCNVMKLKPWLLLLAVLNSVMNPCIYSYKDEEMWTTFKNLMRCIGNGTRRQRSTKANARPLSSQDTGTSQPPSEETKNDDQGILKTWKWNLLRINQNFCSALTGRILWRYWFELTWKRYSGGLCCSQVLSWRDTSGQLLHCRAGVEVRWR